MSSVRSNGAALQSPVGFRFGDFEYDPQRRELRKHGIRARLQPQPLAILLALLESPGTLVSREELRLRLWGSGTFVEFEQGLNSAIKRLRDAICDSADEPRYIETIPGEGYRFIAAVERVFAASEWERFSMPAERGRSSPVPLYGQLADDRQFELGNSTSLRLPAKSVTRPYWSALSAIIAVLSLAIIGLRSHNQPTTHLRAQDWVLVSQFDNRTGEPGLDDIASYTLKAELSSSRLVRIVSPERIQQVLQMMKRPPNATVDGAVGREICLRDGSIKALITGRIAKIGQRYLINVLIVDPATDVAVKGFTEEAADQVGLLHSIRQLSNSVREQLGEALPLIHHDTNHLEPVTTASLHALRLYSAAAAPSAGDDAQVDELLSAALREDPQFASAYIGLAWASLNRDKPKETWLPAARRALGLADNLPERERFFIRGSYNQMVGNPAEAVSAYESLLQLDPHHLDALQHLYELTHRKELLYRLADINADSFEWNRRAWIKSNAEDDVPAEQRFAMRAEQLATPANLESAPVPAEAAVKLAGAYRYLRRGDLGRAQAEAGRASAEFDVLGPRGKNSLAIAEGNFYFFLGELQKADSWYARTDPVSKRFYSSVLAEARGAPFSPSLVRIWDQDATFCLFDPEFAVKLASAGDFRWAEKLAGPQEAALDIARAGLSDYGSLARGGIELYRGNVKNAITSLKRANADLRAGPSIDVRIVGTRLIAAETLASALERKGEIRAAAEVLEPFETNLVFDPEDVLASPAEAWFHLARLYRKLGRIDEANRIESELRVLFADADRDYQLARLLLQSSPSQ
jgi:DNA-binding winged helix-turn-helix (wHTH) protein/tetratricopeptide (TPR) repeat protein